MAKRLLSRRSSLADTLRQHPAATAVTGVSLLLIPVGAAIYFAGLHTGDHNTILRGILCLFLSNMLYGGVRIRDRIIFLVFHVALFTFLLSRPFISMLQDFAWWTVVTDPDNFGLRALFLTLLCLRLGAMAGNRILERRLSAAPPRTPAAEDERRRVFRCALQRTSLLLYAAGLAAHILLSYELITFMHGRNYLEYYTTFQSQYPFYVHTLDAMMKYALCLFLATMPRKRVAFLPLATYLLAAVPSLLIGLRNPIVLAALFILLYYLLRDILHDRERWMGRLEWIGVIVAAPCAMVFLALYAFIRADLNTSMNLWQSIVEFFYSQGVSFEVLSRGYLAIPYLPNVIPKNYTFGPFTDYFLHGTIAQKLFHAVDLGTQNSELIAVYGHSFAHSMSYVANRDYLAGHGWGSSYLLELFVDWGYWGVAIGSVLLGMVLVLMLLAVRRGILARAVTLVSLTTVFFLPRDSALGWLLFTVTIQFWAAVIACYVSAAVLRKLYFTLSGRTKNPLAFLSHPLWEKPDKPSESV